LHCDSARHYHVHDGHPHDSPGLSDHSPQHHSPGHHSSEHYSSEHSGPDCPGQNCHDGQCVFMAGSKTVASKSGSVPGWLPLSAAHASAVAVVARPLAAAIDWRDHVARPVRIHLFNQVLLI
jgi:hypothetical protein